MKILIAEDDEYDRTLLEDLVRQWGYEFVSARDGAAAWQALQADDLPALAIFDWGLPLLDGLEVCQLLRQHRPDAVVYLILLTGRDEPGDVVQGLAAGADDYLTKPFDPGELKARLGVGARLLSMHRELAEKVRQLEQTLAQVEQLHGLLPICAWCKKIRSDQGFWSQVEDYIAAHSDVRFTPAVCLECAECIRAGNNPAAD